MRAITATHAETKKRESGTPQDQSSFLIVICVVPDARNQEDSTAVEEAHGARAAAFGSIRIPPC